MSSDMAAIALGMSPRVKAPYADSISARFDSASAMGVSSAHGTRESPAASHAASVAAPDVEQGFGDLSEAGDLNGLQQFLEHVAARHGNLAQPRERRGRGVGVAAVEGAQVREALLLLGFRRADQLAWRRALGGRV